MMRKDKRKSAPVCLAAAILLACLFAQTTDGVRLIKKGKRVGRKQLDGGDVAVINEGEILFGRALEKDSQFEPQLWKDSSNASVEDAAYQADSPGWLKGSSQDQSAKEATWKRMMPSVQCGLDHMRFKAIGSGTSQLALAQGDSPALPLSQIPPSCGFNMQKNALALVMSVPYDGCNVVQEGGSYVLPLRWQGIPLLLLCTKPTGSPPTIAPPYYPITQGPKNPPSKIYVPQLPHVPQVPQLPPVPQRPQVPQTLQMNPLPYATQVLLNKYPALSEPTLPHPIFFPPFPYPHYHPVSDPTLPIKKPDLLKFPHYHPAIPPLYPYLPFPVTTVAPPAKTTSPGGQTVLDPSQLHHLHKYPPLFPHAHYPFPGLLPGVPQSSVTTELGGKPQIPQIQPYLPFLPPPYPLFPHGYPHVHPQYPTDPKQEMTMPPTTTEKPDPPMLPHFNSHFPSPPHSLGHLHSHLSLPPGVPSPPPHSSDSHLLYHYLLSHGLGPHSNHPPA